MELENIHFRREIMRKLYVLRTCWKVQATSFGDSYLLQSHFYNAWQLLCQKHIHKTWHFSSQNDQNSWAPNGTWWKSRDNDISICTSIWQGQGSTEASIWETGPVHHVHHILDLWDLYGPRQFEQCLSPRQSHLNFTSFSDDLQLLWSKCISSIHVWRLRMVPNWSPTVSRCGIALAFSTLFSSWLRHYGDTNWRQISARKLYNSLHPSSQLCMLCPKSHRSSWSGMRIVSHPRLTKYILSSAKPRWMPQDGRWIAG